VLQAPKFEAGPIPGLRPPAVEAPPLPFAPLHLPQSTLDYTATIGTIVEIGAVKFTHEAVRHVHLAQHAERPVGRQNPVRICRGWRTELVGLATRLSGIVCRIALAITSWLTIRGPRNSQRSGNRPPHS